MAKVKNQNIYSSSPATLNKLAEEYEFIGRRVEVSGDRLTVFALPETWKKKIRAERKLQARREARGEWGTT